ncbi:MAG TPA: PQQ-dependent sugar dehydrogenase [Pyrinomonadaceae bacterium]
MNFTSGLAVTYSRTASDGRRTIRPQVRFASLGSGPISSHATQLVAAGLVLFVCLISVALRAQAQTIVDPGFSIDTVTQLPAFKPVGLTFAPDGRMFIWMENGFVRIYKNGVLLPTPFIDISNHVNTVNDRGLLGFALDPNFSSNGYAYLLYTYENAGNPNDSAPKTARLTRVTANPSNPDVAMPETETVILGSLGTPPCSQYAEGSDCIGSDSDSHTIGTVRFAPDGKMLVSIGDGATYCSVTPLALRAQNLNSYNGKLLRINSNGTAPTDNPFYDGTNSVRSKVYAYGLRNPYRFGLHPTGEPYIGDVGWDSFEEVNRGRGANFGWPCFEGGGRQPLYTQQNFAECNRLSTSDITFGLYTYGRDVGNTVIGGTFYTATQFPSTYQGNFFFADYGRGWIKRMVPGSESQPILFGEGFNNLVSLELGPDGSLYYIALVTGEVRRIRFGNTPTAVASATPSAGYSPLTVNFSSAGSSDPSGFALTYQWNFGDGTGSNLANPVHTYSAAGVAVFPATLTVTNSQGVSASKTINITVGSLPPTATILYPRPGQHVPMGNSVNYTGAAIDPDQTIAPETFSWTLLLHHNEHVHEQWTRTGAGGSFPVEFHGEGTFFYELILTVTDSSGLKGVQRTNVYPSSTFPRLSRDIGNVALAGSFSNSSPNPNVAGTFTLTGSGSDIWDTADSFRYAYHPLLGDGQIVARVASLTNTDAWAKAGVMIRESLTSNSPHAMMVVTAGNGTAFQRRYATGGASAHTGAGGTAPIWVKLVRKLNDFSAYNSADGVNWTLVGTDHINMARNAYIGLAVTSHNNGALCTATFDNVASRMNSIDDTNFFVRQQYLDFFTREPDNGGFAFWTNEINRCANPANRGAGETEAACIERKRVDVSGAFFVSIEFQETGFLVHRFYKASFARMPRFAEFLPDTQSIGRGVIVNQGNWQAQLEENKRQFAEAFVRRQAFRNIYDPLNNQQYVDALLVNATGTTAQPERQALIDGLNNQTETRATVLRKISENNAALKQAEQNPAFVLIQYFGYLGRNPDDPPNTDMSGYNFWLNKLNSFGGDWRAAEMVKAFITSTEYRSRFGQP